MSVSCTELEKALNTLNEAMTYAKASKNDLTLYKIARDACIQRFEYSIELSWKTSMKLLGSQTKFAKPALREMARANLISDIEKWFAFVEARNKTSHSYDEDVASAIYKQIELFYDEAQNLLKLLKPLV